MLRRISTFFVVLFGITFSSPAAAYEVPQWLSNIAETVERKIDAFSEGRENHHNEMTCLALTVYHESRGEPLVGQKMVADVVMNRKRDSRFPSTVCGVVFQRSQFSYLSKRNLSPRDQAAWDRAVEIARDYIRRDTSEWGYLYFNSLGRGKTRVGNHWFR